MKGAGGSEGGLMMYLLGFGMLGLGLWMFVDSIQVTSSYGMIGRFHGGSFMITMGPLVLGIFLLFFDVKGKIAWGVIALGFLVIIVDVVSGLRLRMHMKLWQWIILVVFMVGGLALIVRSFFPGRRTD